jgi:hypothetical protein
MLRGCSWQAFLIAAAVFTLVWVGIMLVVYFRKDLWVFFSGGRLPGPEGEARVPLPHAWQDDVDPVADNLMGKASLPDGVSVVEQGGFSFKAGVPGTDAEDRAADPYGVDDDDDASLQANSDAAEILQSDVFDLMEELKSLLGDQLLSRDDFIARVNERVRSYSGLLKSPLLDSVYELIAEQVNASEVLGFELSAEELKEHL